MSNRVLNRKGARALTSEEIELIKSGAGTNCTFRTTHIGHIIDDLVDDCGPAQNPVTVANRVLNRKALVR